MLILPVKIISTVAFISQIDRLRIYFISKLRFFFFSQCPFMHWDPGWSPVSGTHYTPVCLCPFFSLPHSALPCALKGVHWTFAGEQWCVFSGLSVCCVPVSLGLGCCVETLAADGQP